MFKKTISLIAGLTFILSGITVCDSFKVENATVFADSREHSPSITSVSVSAKYSVIEGYKNILDKIKKSLPSDGMIYYSVYDMNKDNIPELIVKSGSSEGDFKINVYSYSSKKHKVYALKKGISGFHSYFYKDKSNGDFVTAGGVTGGGFFKRFKYSKGKLKVSEKEFTYSLDRPYDYEKKLSKYAKIQSVPYVSYYKFLNETKIHQSEDGEGYSCSLSYLVENYYSGSSTKISNSQLKNIASKKAKMKSSDKIKMKKAYKKIISSAIKHRKSTFKNSGTYYYNKYSVYDINKDNIPELILSYGEGGQTDRCKIYSFSKKSKKAYKIKNTDFDFKTFEKDLQNGDFISEYSLTSTQFVNRIKIKKGRAVISGKSFSVPNSSGTIAMIKNHKKHIKVSSLPYINRKGVLNIDYPYGFTNQFNQSRKVGVYWLIDKL